MEKRLCLFIALFTIFVFSFQAVSAQEDGYCGDGTCQSDESCSSCSQDCGECQQTLSISVYSSGNNILTTAAGQFIYASATDPNGVVRTTNVYVDNALAKSCPQTSCRLDFSGTDFSVGEHTYYAEARDIRNTAVARDPAGTATRKFSIVRDPNQVVEVLIEPAQPRAGSTIKISTRYPNSPPASSESVRIYIDDEEKTSCTDFSRTCEFTFSGSAYADGRQHAYYAKIINIGGDILSPTYRFSVSGTTAGFTLTVTKTGNGRITGGGIDCGSTCRAENITSGISVTLTAAPDTGQTFAGWGGACSGTQMTCTLTMDANKNVSAAFSGSQQNQQPLPESQWESFFFSISRDAGVAPTSDNLRNIVGPAFIARVPGTEVLTNADGYSGKIKLPNGVIVDVIVGVTGGRGAGIAWQWDAGDAPGECRFGPHLSGFNEGKFNDPNHNTVKYKAARAFACFTTPQISDAVMAKLRDAGLNPTKISSDVIDFDVTEAGKKVGQVDVIFAVGGPGAVWQWLPVSDQTPTFPGTPFITSVSPTTVQRGATLTITGSSLTNVVQFFYGSSRHTETGSVNAARTQTTVAVPGILPDGSARIRVYAAADRYSNDKTITVGGGVMTGDFAISGVSPNPAAAGQVLTVTGTGLVNIIRIYSSTNQRWSVIGSVNAAGTQTTVTLPGDLAAGAYTVKAYSAGRESNGLALTVGGGAAQPLQIIVQNIGDGVFPDVAWFNNELYVAYYTTNDRKIIVKKLSDSLQTAATLEVEPGDAGGGFPRLGVYNNFLHIIYRKDDGSVIYRPVIVSGNSMTAGTPTSVGTGFGINPVAIGNNYIAWQTSPTLAKRLSLAPASVVEDVPIQQTSTGINRILSDGTIRLIHQERLAVPWGTMPWYANDLTVAQAQEGGIVAQFGSDASSRFIIMPGEDTKDPHAAANGNRYAVATWGAPGMRIALVTRQAAGSCQLRFTSNVANVCFQIKKTGETAAQRKCASSTAAETLSVSPGEWDMVLDFGSIPSGYEFGSVNPAAKQQCDTGDTKQWAWTFDRITSLSLSKRAVTLAAAQGGSNPTDSFTITNRGTQPLTWSVSDNADWLTVRRNFAGGETSGREAPGATSSPPLTVTANIAGLSAGTHRAVITVTSSDGVRDVPVTLTISAGAAENLADLLTYKQPNGAYKMMLAKAGDSYDTKSGTIDTNQEIYPAKLNSDSITDFILYNPSDRSVKKIIVNEDNTISVSPAGTLPNRANLKIMLADFNGDGISDIFAYNDAGNNLEGHRCLNTGGSYTSCTVTTFNQYMVINVAKLNSDNRDDLLLYGKASDNWQSAKSNANGFDLATGSWGAGYDVLAADFSGDGLTDFFLYKPESGEWKLQAATSSGFTAAGQGTIASGFKTYAADFNDGKPDVLLYNPASGRWEEFINTGTGLPAGGPARSGTWEAELELHQTDINGDSRTDFIAYRSSNGEASIKRSTGVGTFEEKALSMDAGAKVISVMPAASTLGFQYVQLGEHRIEALSANPSAVSVTTTGETRTRTSAISGGTAPYSKRDEPNSAVATAALAGSTLSVTGVSGGTTSVVIRDSSLTPLTLRVPIIVSSAAANRFVLAGDTGGFAFAGSGLTRQEIGDAPANIYTALYMGTSTVFAYVIEFNNAGAADAGKSWIDSRISRTTFTMETRNIGGSNVAVYTGTGQSIVMWTYNNYVVVVTNIGDSRTPDDVIKAYMDKYSAELSRIVAPSEVTAEDLQEVKSRMIILKNRFADLQGRANELADHYRSSDAALSARYTTAANMFSQAKTMSENIAARIDAGEPSVVADVRSRVGELRTFLRQVLLAALGIETSLSGSGGLFG